MPSASRTFLSGLLPPAQLAAGLALNRIAFQASMLVGPALGGLIVGWAGVGGCYLIDTITFAVAFYGAFGLPPMRPDGEPSRPGLSGVLAGLRFLAGHPAVRGALLTDLAATVLSMPISLFPLINAERFGDDPRTRGWDSPSSRWPVPRTPSRSSRAARSSNYTRRTRCSAGWPPPSRSSARPDRMSATCAAASSPA